MESMGLYLHAPLPLPFTWYDRHDVVRKEWDDGTCNCILKSPSSRGKRIMVLHAGGRQGWVPNCLYLSVRNIQDSKADSHDEMTVDELATSYGHEVLHLPPYHCVLNPIELVWARLKSHVRKNNTTPTLSASVCEHLREGVENINSNLWSSCVDHTIKVGERYWIQDTTGDGERFIVDLRESDTDDE
ncbi:hypothetical protein ANN_02956 [Periplaneta americana]|uniref:Tc1-like transposase DDE domain-containing protein n=1 Tax=Periplaneta americana TaxID=6978 RepID=A0ABQ8TYW0_PERAM|nr:hypothetical protein ANN_02956 [Periplaneta americana]